MNSFKLLVKSLDNIYPSSYDVLDTQFEGEEPPEKVEEHLDVPEDPKVELKEEAIEKEPIHSTSNSLNFILYIPNYLIIKPILFTWLLVTYPFTRTFEALGLISSTTNEYVYDEPENYETEDSLLHKTQLLKDENIISNTIKSPTSSSKYIIPPPQRLYPFSRNPQKKKKKTLVLDLDETLIHSLSRTSPRISSLTSSSRMIEIKINNDSTLYYVYKRPFCDFFLQEISNWFDIQIFTASVKEYADPIIDWLESELVTEKNEKGNQPFFSKRYYRRDCTYRRGVGYIKDLSKYFPREELKNVIILDNSPISYALHENNGVMIEGWINDTGDRDLLNLLPLLHGLSLSIDVRLLLGLRVGERLFE